MRKFQINQKTTKLTKIKNKLNLTNFIFKIKKSQNVILISIIADNVAS